MVDSKIDCDTKAVLFRVMPGRCLMDVSLAPLTASVSHTFSAVVTWE
jgi:hypothetical protein